MSKNAPSGQRTRHVPGNVADPYFGLPLWLQIACGDEILWMFNARHLDFIEEYVRATNRRRPPVLPGGLRNSLLESRLPRWMKLARNREAVLGAIAKLRSGNHRRAH